MRALLILIAAATFISATYGAPAPVEREFRGMWIATVGNIDWPSKSGLPVSRQQAELVALLDKAKQLNLNVVVLQVRTSADALYDSPLEPWSEYLTGRMGQAPEPRWDPLKFACAQAHDRALELHAWINPYRARYHGIKSPPSRAHVSQAHPSWTVPHGRYLWIDPGNVEAQKHTLNVVRDLVRRYDVDGLHIDDYFYPYPEKHPLTGAKLPFADQATFNYYRRQGGKLTLDDWRRQNVNVMVERISKAIHAEKSWVKFGVSPFGIWRPNSPAGVQGLDQYAVLYADARLWLNRGWADYFAPQLYWPTDRLEQSFTALLRWWNEQNTGGRLLVPGLASASIGKDRQASDIAAQVRLIRETDSAGMLFWNASSLAQNKGGIAAGLASGFFRQPALPPATPWLGTNIPVAPKLKLSFMAGGAKANLTWRHAAYGEPVRFTVLQTRLASRWQTEILGAAAGDRTYEVRQGKILPDEIWLRGVSRSGVVGEAAVWGKDVSPLPRRPAN